MEGLLMKAVKLIGMTFVLLAGASLLAGQEQKEANSAAAPPNLVLLVHQDIQRGKGGERQKLEVAMARSGDRLEAPGYWVHLQSLTGAREELSFDPFDNFDEMEQAEIGWRQFYAAHPDLGRLQEEIDAIVEGERAIVAVRRDDLGYDAENINLSEMRYLRVLEVRLIPGHESDFEEALTILRGGYAKIEVDTRWMVYEVNAGMSGPAFLVFVPMQGLGKNDELLAAKVKLLEAEGDDIGKRLEQLARESYASTESNLYAVRPEMSHVSKEWAAGDVEFWRPRREPETRLEVKPEAKPSVKPAKKGT
jgi:hypothetical protein